jgi:hypothetical protein
MATVQSFCDRAMLIHDGEQRFLGDPEEAALRYYRLNFARSTTGSAQDATPASVPDVNVTMLDCWLEDEAGARVDNVEQGQRFRLTLVVRARQALQAPVFNFHCQNMDGNWVFALTAYVQDGDGQPRSVAAGEHVRIVAEIDNPLLPGRYAFHCWISRAQEEGGMAIHILRLIDFYVFGTKPGPGNVGIAGEIEAVIG